MIYHDIPAIASHFRFAGPLTQVEVLGSGHINETFRLTCRTERGFERTILQRINRNVFADPQQVIENVQRVT